MCHELAQVGGLPSQAGARLKPLPAGWSEHAERDDATDAQQHEQVHLAQARSGIAQCRLRRLPGGERDGCQPSQVETGGDLPDV
jgi:hypothetical protein